MTGDLFGDPSSGAPNAGALLGMTVNAIPRIDFASGGSVRTDMVDGRPRTRFRAGPAERALLDSALASALNFGAAGGSADQVEQSTFDRAMRLLEPTFAERDISLSNRGIPIGSEIWQRDQDQRDRARSDLALGSVQAGRNERSRLLGEILGILTGTPQMRAPQAPLLSGSELFMPTSARMSGQAQQTGYLQDFVGGLFGLGGGLAAGGMGAGG